MIAFTCSHIPNRAKEVMSDIPLPLYASPKQFEPTEVHGDTVQNLDISKTPFSYL